MMVGSTSFTQGISPAASLFNKLKQNNPPDNLNLYYLKFVVSWRPYPQICVRVWCWCLSAGICCAGWLCWLAVLVSVNERFTKCGVGKCICASSRVNGIKYYTQTRFWCLLHRSRPPRLFGRHGLSLKISFGESLTPKPDPYFVLGYTQCSHKCVARKWMRTNGECWIHPRLTSDLSQCVALLISCEFERWFFRICRNSFAHNATVPHMRNQVQRYK